MESREYGPGTAYCPESNKKSGSYTHANRPSPSVLQDRQAHSLLQSRLAISIDN